IKDVFLRYDDNLAIGFSDRPVSDSAELLQGADTARALRQLKQTLEPNVIIYDLPPMLLSDDVLAFLPNVDCTMLVVAAEVNTLNEIGTCEGDLAERTNVLGVVLNKCNYPPEKYGYY